MSSSVPSTHGLNRRSSLTDVLEGPPPGSAVEAELAALHGAESVVLFGDAERAITDVLLACTNEEGEVLASCDLPRGRRRWLAASLASAGRTVRFVDCADLDALAASVGSLSQVVLTPSVGDPSGRLVPLNDLAVLSHANDLLLIVDNTGLSGALLRPLELGADLVIERAAGLLTGRPIAGGLVAGSRRLVARVLRQRPAAPRWNDEPGASDGTGSSDERARVGELARALSLGLATLKVRALASSAAADELARLLSAEPWVGGIRRPSFESDPWSRESVRGFGPVVAVELADPMLQPHPAPGSGAAWWPTDGSGSSGLLRVELGDQTPAEVLVALRDMLATASSAGLPGPDPDVLHGLRLDHQNAPWEAQAKLAVMGSFGEAGPHVACEPALLGSERAVRPVHLFFGASRTWAVTPSLPATDVVEGSSDGPAGLQPLPVLLAAVGAALLQSVARVLSVSGSVPEMLVVDVAAEAGTTGSVLVQELEICASVDRDEAEYAWKIALAHSPVHHLLATGVSPRVVLAWQGTQTSAGLPVPPAGGVEPALPPAAVRVVWQGGVLCASSSDGARLMLDQPHQLDGTDGGISPEEAVLAALAAEALTWPGADPAIPTGPPDEVHVSGRVDLRGVYDLTRPQDGLRDLLVQVLQPGGDPQALTTVAELRRLNDWVHRAPVLRLLSAPVQIVVRLKPPPSAMR